MDCITLHRKTKTLFNQEAINHKKPLPCTQTDAHQQFVKNQAVVISRAEGSLCLVVSRTVFLTLISNLRGF